MFAKTFEAKLHDDKMADVTKTTISIASEQQVIQGVQYLEDLQNVSAAVPHQTMKSKAN